MRNVQRPKPDEEFHSEIYLKANLYLKMPKTIAKPVNAEESKTDEQMTITYFVWYAGQDFTWTEQCSTDMHKSQQILLEYGLGQADQTVHVEVLVQSAQDQHKTKVKFQLHEVINQTLSSVKPVRPFETQSKSKRRVEIRMKCAPTKQDDQLSKLKFNSRITFSDPYQGKNLHVKIGEVSMGKIDYFL